MACRGRCGLYKVSAPFGQKYATGIKRCTQCDMFTRWEGIRCPCCNQQLRFRPLSAKNKRQYRKAVGVKIVQ